MPPDTWLAVAGLVVTIITATVKITSSVRGMRDEMRIELSAFRVEIARLETQLAFVFKYPGAITGAQINEGQGHGGIRRNNGNNQRAGQGVMD